MAVKGTIGRDITPVAPGSYNYTWIAKRDPATANGKVYQVVIEVWDINTPNTSYIKLFRINGSNYDVIYNETITGLSAGENTVNLATPWNVLSGDLIGYHGGVTPNNVALSYEAGSGTGHHRYPNTNVITTTPIAEWTPGTETMGLRANIMSIPGGSFLLFLSEAWNRHKKLWTPKGLILPEDLGFSY